MVVHQNYDAIKHVHQNLGGRWTLDAKGQKNSFLIVMWIHHSPR